MMDFTRLAMRYSMGVGSPRSFSVIKNVDEIDPERAMDELRETNPEEAMLLGEYVVFDDPRNDPPPSS